MIKPFNQLLHHILQIPLVLSRQHADQLHDLRYQFCLVKVQILNQIVKDVRMFVDKFFREISEQLSIPPNNNSLLLWVLFRIDECLLQPLKHVVKLFRFRKQFNDHFEEAAVDFSGQLTAACVSIPRGFVLLEYDLNNVGELDFVHAV